MYFQSLQNKIERRSLSGLGAVCLEDWLDVCAASAQSLLYTQASTEKCCLLFKKCYQCKRHIDQYSEEVVLKRPWQRGTSQW